jgi:hypothetical protein
MLSTGQARYERWGGGKSDPIPTAGGSAVLHQARKLDQLRDTQQVAPSKQAWLKHSASSEGSIISLEPTASPS